MGQIADALRANLRELAQSDARSLRALEAELGAGQTRRAPATPTAALGDGLERLTVKALKARCRVQRLTGLSKASKAELIKALREAASTASPLGKACEDPATPAPATELARLEARIERLEALLLLIAGQVGVPAAALQRTTRSPY